MTGTPDNNTVEKSMEMIRLFFPNLSPLQQQQYAMMLPLYKEWNAQINVISRKDIDNLYLHHVLHSLAIAKVLGFAPGSHVLDVGTGGGFPGIPLAVMFPQVQFDLVDSIGKKIKVVEAVAQALELKNVHARQCRAETMERSYDFIVSRAVTRLPEFYGWVSGKIKKPQKNVLPNGILYLKGGDVSEETKPFGRRITEYGINTLYNLEPGIDASALSGELAEAAAFFETKKVIYLAF